MSRCDDFTFSVPPDDGFFVVEDGELEVGPDSATIYLTTENNVAEVEGEECVVNVAAEDNVFNVQYERAYAREER